MNEPKSASLNNLRWKLFLLGLFKIPMIGYLRPRLIQINDEFSEVKIRLRRKSTNHLGSMYFGALMVGADVASGIHVFYFADKMDKKVSFSFKSVSANFIKRAESDIAFKFNEGRKVQELMEKSLADRERMNSTFRVSAFNTHNELVAEFEMELSVKII